MLGEVERRGREDSGKDDVMKLSDRGAVSKFGSFHALTFYPALWKRQGGDVPPSVPHMAP